ncbi:MAG: bifunctional proline dehydrogenase/L-glutamate gamma-semialdehyde dehydrogenase PutA [Rhodospirillales bacterium]|nr:bifunctional proline dehydrogenase/L-glutamate gamma-semialdehyde dehydrogenase PutA [Rhodospirillales bacterium]
MTHERPFAAFAADRVGRDALRRRITDATRRPESECLPPLLQAARLPSEVLATAETTATRLITTLRARRLGGSVEGLMQEYALSSEEGVALMCLAEALLRIPDSATRDALIRDKIGGGDWRAHLGHSPSLFVNAATWGLVVTGSLTSLASETGLSGALARLVTRGGEPLIRRGVDVAMRLLGEQFVMGETIPQALARARAREAQGFRHSYDMLGEAAATAADARRYRDAYAAAIHAIGAAAEGRGPIEGPGISIKLSALHPRYSRAQRQRMLAELYPVLRELVLLARRYDIGINLDAEEADRLEPSLDLLEALCREPALAGWGGIGFVVQAYQKRAPYVLDWIVALGRATGHRLMLRLVKGAYWDAEIKRAQLDGLADYPVYTRKVHTDVAYLACARKLLAAPDAVFAQFATHNAMTLAAVHALAGADAPRHAYEFQCLHGMGEPLYEQVVGNERLGRPCRIYAPVGTHETLLAYLVRRLLENGANASFVHRIADTSVPVAELVADPVAQAAAIVPPGQPHPAILLPRDMLGGRANALGLDLADENVLEALATTCVGAGYWHASPLLADGPARGAPRELFNPADHTDMVGTVVEADPAIVARAIAFAEAAAPAWAATAPARRAAILRRAADLLEARTTALIPLIVREAGKSIANAVGEVREAVDFLRYDADAIAGFDNATHRPLGAVVAISPWNFPLSIFTGQVAAALAAGNAVLAKPAPETPLVAAEAVAILHEAGVPAAALQLLPGGTTTGAALVADRRIRGVLFTGSTEAARHIQASLAHRMDDVPVPLIAETGGQNAMVVDSSALPEQVVADAIRSAFDSAGQRCSALRVLCVQEDAADRIFSMLRGAMRELAIGNPDRLATDIGPVISARARDTILAHIGAMRARGHAVETLPLPDDCADGTFVAPTLIEIQDMSELEREVFGPVLHLLRFRRDRLDALIGSINATGYALTFGVHTRIAETEARATTLAAAGNIYVNRDLIGAVVGVQPFGGRNLSGTGPKAGGPLYLRRLMASAPPPLRGRPAQPALDWHAHLAAQGSPVAAPAAALIATSPLGYAAELQGAVGERNRYELVPRGTVLCLGERPELAIAAALATGNRALVTAGTMVPPALAGHIVAVADWRREAFDAVLFEGAADAARTLAEELSRRPGPIVTLQTAAGGFCLDLLVAERSISVNTAAAGGNATLMALV